METRRHRLGTAVVVGLLALFAWWVLRPHEPRYRGRPLSHWLQAAAQGGVYQPGGDKSPAAMALRSMGTDAIPLLLRLASTPMTDFRDFVGDLADEDMLSYLHAPPQHYKHEVAVWGFKLLRADARPAVPSLVRLLGRPERDLQVCGLQCLAALGTNSSEAVPDIVKLLQKHSANVPSTTPAAVDQDLVWEAACALGDIGPAAAAAIPVLAAETNKAVALVLLRIRGENMDTFFTHFRDTSDLVQWSEVLRAVQRFGGRPQAAVPPLIEALSTTNDAIKVQAIAELGRIHERPDLCLPVLSELLQDGDEGCRNNAIVALGEFGAAARPALPEVLKLLKAKDVGLRSLASNALVNIDPEQAARAGVKAATNDAASHR